MPKTSFFNLSEDKRDLIISLTIEEFATANFATASINQICKRANIAKGSFYQYFTDKLDLYIYVMTLAIEKKVNYFTAVLGQFNNLTLLDQIRLLFLKGLEFAKEYPQYAALGEQFSKENNETAKLAVIKEGDKQSENLFVHLIDQAKLRGEISSEVDTLALSMMLQSLGRTVNEYMQNMFGGASYSNYDEEMNKLVDALLTIISRGINHN
jgi:TetR/AcrR family transcriptional regulator